MADGSTQTEIRGSGEKQNFHCEAYDFRDHALDTEGYTSWNEQPLEFERAKKNACACVCPTEASQSAYQRSMDYNPDVFKCSITHKSCNAKKELSPSSPFKTKRHYTACGGSHRCKSPPTPEHDSSLHEVRCCSDKAHKRYNKRPGCSVWGESLDINQIRCIHSATWQQAYDHCAADGARLCTAEELAADCTRGSGCQHDADMIWSLTPAAEHHELECADGLATTIPHCA
jgi:hypothetical protein